MTEQTTAEPRPRIRWQLLTIVRETLREGPATYRHALGWMAGVCIAMLALQTWDVWGRRGPGVVAELLGVVAGTLGIALVGVINLLHAASEHASQREALAPGGPTDGDGIHHILIALPAIGFTAGVLLAASLSLYVIRGVLGAPLPLVASVILFDAFLLVIAARTVTETTQLLYAHARDRAAAAARAEAHAADARLSALQAQVNPHFLFNALNTVAALTRSNPRAAEATVENLADVLRRTLVRSTARLSTLGEEIEYLRAYLAIEQWRRGDRLRVECDVPDTLVTTPIVPLALQPLVENALKHGIGSRLSGGTIRVAAQGTGAGVRIIVSDDGEGFPATYGEGIGLRNLRDRLAAVHGPTARLEIERPPGGPPRRSAAHAEETGAPRGASVAVVIPVSQEVDRARPDRR